MDSHGLGSTAESFIEVPVIPVSNFILRPIITVAPEGHGLRCGLSRRLGRRSELANWADKPHHGLAHGRSPGGPGQSSPDSVALLASQRFGETEHAHGHGYRWQVLMGKAQFE